MESVVSSELIAAYRRADYRVPARGLLLKVDEACEALVGWVKGERAKQGAGFAFITAFNPYSEERSAEENRAATERLHEFLERFQPEEVLEAVGSEQDGSAAEGGFLVSGLTLEEASEAGREFQQNAVLWAGPDACPRLMLLR